MMYSFVSYGALSTEMHRCLAVPELLNLIFKEVHTSAKGGVTVAALARTSKCFQDAALDTLWEKQTSLVPLVKCFPQEIWKETRQEDGSKKLVCRDLLHTKHTYFSYVASPLSGTPRQKTGIASNFMLPASAQCISIRACLWDSSL